ncbi:MAG: dipeptidase [Rhodothermales bacterium]|nr:dipeptidase [Rhodothermales bacterium]
MSTPPHRPLAYARAHRRRFVEELKDLVRIPSVSAEPEHAPAVTRCARWLADHLRRLGPDEVRLFRTARHPAVYAAWRKAAGRPTVLVYGHYDVQPADHPERWTTPPFEPAVRGENLYGRGASDDKGQLFAHVKAIEAYVRGESGLPVNVVCLFEGEEEIGSLHLKALLERERHRLAADVAVISDMRILGPKRPALTYALRGALNLELTVRGPTHALHSGTFGGAVHNPAQALCEIVAALHRPDGRIALPGFYRRVRRWSAAERAFMRRMGYADAHILNDAGSRRGWGEPGFSLYERTTIRPALSITGLTSGYQGAGPKSIIPKQARAKLNFRLVPDQHPREVEQLVRRYVARRAPPTVRVDVRTQFAANAVYMDRRHPGMRAAALAYRKGFGAAPAFLRSGGTIPVADLFVRLMKVPTVLMGFALPDDRMHAANEKFFLPNFYNGIATCLWFFHHAAALPASARRAAHGRAQSTTA